MDPLTQASIGSAAAQTFSKVPLKTALWIGALGGFLPDADVLIRSTEDPLLHLEYHRHFTHSLLFIPVGGFITASIGKLLSRGKMHIKDIWFPATLGWATHGLLDSCTSYGTYLLWPFSNVRVAWDNVSIIDPLLTLPLVIGVILAARRQNRIMGQMAFAWVITYLLFGVFQRERASDVYSKHIVERGHVASAIEVKPSIGNNILFRGFYMHGDTFYADSIRVPWLGDAKIYDGSSIPALNIEQLRQTLEPIHQHDLDRFVYFSNGFVVEDPNHEGYIGDFRYALVPNEIAPLWGINMGARVSGQHVEFQRFSKPTPEQRQTLMKQMKGQ